MKQYTNESQTAKLIELGFEMPRLLYFGNNTIGHYAYTIGELIEMLPREYDGELLEILAVSLTCSKWTVRYPYGIIINKKELIDALFEMLVQLKEEGVI